MTSLSFIASFGKPEDRRRRNRTRAIQVRRTVEDVTQKEFDDALNKLKDRDFVRDQSVIAELSENRDKIMYSEKRMNQTYLAGALVLWYQLGKPSYKQLLRIDSKIYQRESTPIILAISDIKEKSLNEQEIQPEESTLFRYLSEIAVCLDFDNSIEGK